MVQFQVYIFLATAEGDPMTIHRGEAVLTTGNRVRLQQRHPRQPMQLLLHGPPVPVSYQPREEIDGPMSTADFNSNIIQMLILRRDEPARASPPLPLLRAQPSRSSACSTRRRHGSQTSLFCDWRSLNKKPGLLLRGGGSAGADHERASVKTTVRLCGVSSAWADAARTRNEGENRTFSDKISQRSRGHGAPRPRSPREPLT